MKLNVLYRILLPVDTVAEPVDTVAEPVDTVAEPVDTVAEPVEATVPRLCSPLPDDQYYRCLSNR